MALSNRTPMRLADAVRLLLYTERCPHCDHPRNEPESVAPLPTEGAHEVANYTCERCAGVWQTTWHQYGRRA